MPSLRWSLFLGLGVVLLASCDDEGTEGEPDVYRFAGGCYTVNAGGDFLARSGNDEAYEFSGGQDGAARFTMQASGLGTYLLYDRDGGYLVAEDGPLLRQTTLESNQTVNDDTYVSGAEWILEDKGGDGYQLRNKKTDQLLGVDGLTESGGATLRLEEAEGCAEHPELTLDANGDIERTTWEDGDLYGIVDSHEHILSNVAFGGGGIFHGAPFHPLGVEHALPDCEDSHGEMGRKDFFGFIFDESGNSDVDLAQVLPQVVSGELEEDNHFTAGYPEFTEWPSAPNRSTHQVQYYKWLERAWMSGLRLVVQDATTNSIICHFMVGSGVQKKRHSCEDMVNVDRIIEETYAMEAYIDAQHGGPGKGWFRIVLSPEEARDVISEGKLAVVLGIETADLFDCRLTPREDSPICDEDYVDQQLDAYYDQGIRVIFPVHKYDNKFSAGDGDRAFIELGNFFNTGHWGNFVDDGCPDINSVFDKGNVEIGGINMPREVYDSEPPNDFSDFPDVPLGTAFPFLSNLSEPPLEGNYCQKTGLTPLGEYLMDGLMKRGMIIEIDHLPRRSYAQAFDILEANDYPAAGTHGTNNDGKIYELGGISKWGVGRCRAPGEPGKMFQSLTDRVAMKEAVGAYPAEGFGFDLNGFAGARGGRFAEGACADPQTDPVTYPFESYAGDVTFTEPQIGNRTIDYNEEGFVHIGILPEMIEDMRNDAESDDQLEPLFRSAEGWVRMWEKAESRATDIGG